MYSDNNELKTEQDNILDQWIEAEKKIAEKNNKVLDQVKEKVSKEAYDEIIWIMEDCVAYVNYKITDKPKGEYQKNEELEVVKGYWVDQTTNGGMTGDEFAGTVSIKLNEKEYFEFYYNC